MEWDLVSGLVGAAIMGGAWFVRHVIESAQRAREAFQVERFDIYVSILAPLMEGMAGMKRKGAVKDFRMAILRLNLMAPDNVARAAHTLFQTYSDDTVQKLSLENQVAKMSDTLGGLMLEIRRDLGNPGTSLTGVDMMRVLVKDIGAYSPKGG